MKIFNLVFIVLFIISAGLQYNDPDPYVWMPLYLFAAWLCYEALRKKYKPLLYITSLAIYTLYALYLFFEPTGVLYWLKQRNAENITQTMKASTPWIEATREFFGLVIIITVLLINMAWLRKRENRKTVSAVTED